MGNLKTFLFAAILIAWSNCFAFASVVKRKSSTLDSLDIFDIPDVITRTDDFTVKVRPRKGGRWQEVTTFGAYVSEQNTTTGSSTNKEVSAATFDFDEEVDVSIKYNAGKAKTFAVRPYSRNIDFSKHGNTIQFSLAKPQNLMIQVNNDRFTALSLFTNYVDRTVIDENDSSVWYFGPGVNNCTAAANISTGYLYVPSNTQLYLSPGAVINGTVMFTDVSNSSIKGHGISYKASGSGGVNVERSSNIHVEDLIFVNPNGYAVNAAMADSVFVNGIRAFSSKGWGDGIDYFCSTNSRIDNVFMRNSDDTIALYQHRNNWSGDSSNITITNSTLWADVAHGIVMGTHGNTENPETMSGITIENMDIMYHKEHQMWYQGCIAINPGDSNLIKDVYINDVRVEEIADGQLVNMRVMFNSKYNTSPGRGIEDVVIKGLKYSGPNYTPCNPSLILAYDEERTIKNVTFYDLEVNGKLIYDDMEKPSWYYTSDYVPMYIEDVVSNFTFKKSG